jgi:hypothetical protein
MQLISGVAPKAALPQVWAGQADVTHPGSEQPLVVAVVVGGALSRAALMWSDADRHGILGLQQALSIPAQHLGDQGATDATSRAYIEPGSPWENGFAEWLNCRFRDELLNTEQLTRLQRLNSWLIAGAGSTTHSCRTRISRGAGP